MTFPTEWKKQKKHVPNHQPVYDICLKCKAYRLDRGICLENKGYLFHPVKMASRQNSKFLMHSLFQEIVVIMLDLGVPKFGQPHLGTAKNLAQNLPFGISPIWKFGGVHQEDGDGPMGMARKKTY